MPTSLRILGLRAGLAAALLIAGCSSDSSDSDGDTVAVSGTVTFDYVPVVEGAGIGTGLSHSATTPRPARLVTVEFVSRGLVRASTRTTANGTYTLDVPGNTTGFMRVRAESIRAGVPGWNFRVVDNTNNSAQYTLDGNSFSTGSANSTRDLHADSGWTGAAYGAPRSAAPFAILDAIYQGAEFMLESHPTLVMPPLTLHWSPDNTAVSGPTNVAAGELPGTFSSTLDGLQGIYIVGNAAIDADEYDRHVLLHEFSHFLEWSFWRTDSIGGAHTFGDRLDMRLAFAEGFGNAFSGIVQDDPIYRDSFILGASWFDLEADDFGAAPRGWYSEQSIQELVYDFADGDVDGVDNVQLDFSVLFDVFADKFTTMRPLTSLFPFVQGLKQEAPAQSAAIDLLLTAQNIAPILDDYGSNRQNDAGASIGTDVLPIYTDLVVNGGPVNVCSTSEMGLDEEGGETVTGVPNKLGTRRFVRFTPSAAGTVTVRVTATEIPPDNYADPDFWVFAAGAYRQSEGPPSATCEAFTAPGWTPSSCFEQSTIELRDASEHILEVYEWTNAAFDLEAGEEPIGRTCFDVTVTTP
jgi:hypothetical protein